MGEFLQNYGFFILLAILMVICHLGHGGHGHHGRGRDDDTERKDTRPGPGGHQH